MFRQLPPETCDLAFPIDDAIAYSVTVCSKMVYPDIQLNVPMTVYLPTLQKVGILLLAGWHGILATLYDATWNWQNSSNTFVRIKKLAWSTYACNVVLTVRDQLTELLSTWLLEVYPNNSYNNILLKDVYQYYF